MKLVYNQTGWRVWRTETKDGVRCRAIKSAKGQPHPQPLGFRDSLWKGTPYLSLSKGYKSNLSVDLAGRWGFGGEWRDLGDKFWENRLDFQDLAIRDGRQIEVHLKTWEYNAIKVGLAEERGLIDLTGLRAVLEALKACDDEIVIPETIDPSKPSIRSIGYVTYPYDARRAGISGAVGYVATISAAGKALDCEVIEPLKFASLNEAACDAVLNRVTFRPALNSNFEPVVSSYEGTIRFAAD